MNLFKNKHNFLLIVCIIIFIIQELLGEARFNNFIPQILLNFSIVLDFLPVIWLIIFTIGFICSRLNNKINVFTKVYNFTMKDKFKSAISFMFLLPELFSIAIFSIVIYYFIKFLKKYKSVKKDNSEKEIPVFKFDYGTVVGYDDSNGNKYIKKVVYVSGIQEMGLADYDFIDPYLIDNYTLERFEQNEFEIYIGDRKLEIHEMHRLPSNPKTYNFFNWQY